MPTPAETLLAIEEWARESIEGIRDDLEKSDVRADFNRGCLKTLRQVLQIIDPPRLPAVDDVAPAAEPFDGPPQFIS